MKKADDEALKKEKDRAKRIMRDVYSLLQGRGQFAAVVSKAYDWVFTFLVQGRHKNPVHHTPWVVRSMVEITRDQTLTRSQWRLGLLAAVFHDAGNAFEPRGQGKITAEHVRQDPTLLEAAIKQRERHMRNGALLVELFSGAKGAPRLNAKDIRNLKHLVEHHDDPTIAQLLLDAKRLGKGNRQQQLRRYLFGPGQGRLAVMLREADRLWMLTPDGIVADLRRKEQKRKPWHAQSQITHNVIRHWEERQLYEDAEMRQVSGLRFGADSAFYRTKNGQQLFLWHQRSLRAQRKSQWAKGVKKGVFPTYDPPPHI